ncbi:GRRM system radical SAM/SPASM domain protein [Dyadobacter sp. CY261]|nr:GRRM system radical SAM/SPASM domain protein [Dyadobacter sp. CY261]
MSTKRMDLKVVKKIAEEVFSSSFISKPVDFLWHLGEPLALPISFYEDAFTLIKEINKEYFVEYSLTFQTNAMLLNESWIDLIKRHQVNIGVSIDGPAFLHDKKRVDRKNRGTHAQVMNGVRLLQANGIPFGVIAVITNDSLNYANEICDFFLDNNIYNIGFNIDEMDGINKSSTFRDVEAGLYKSFIKTLFDRSVASKGLFKIREFWVNIRPFTVDIQNPFNTTNNPFAILNFDCHGNYSTFCPELIGVEDLQYNNFIMGNIVTDGLAAIRSSPLFLRMHEEIQVGVNSCRDNCDYWSFCGGGAPSNKYFENGSFSSTETIACKYQKQIVVDVLAEHFEKQFAIEV